MYRRRKRAKYTWLPTQFLDAGDQGKSAARSTNLNVTTNNEPSLAIVPILMDVPEQGTSSLGQDTGGLQAVVQSNEYFIRRIVGNFWAALNQNTDGAAVYPSSALLTIGLFIARAEDDSADTFSVPIGATADVFRQYSPNHPDTIREPWIFRRQWILGNSLKTDDPTTSFFPPTNGAIAGSVSGPHIDIKTMRRVHQTERLWMAMESRAWPIDNNFGLTGEGFIAVTWDFRVLGALRRARQHGAF